MLKIVGFLSLVPLFVLYVKKRLKKDREEQIDDTVLDIIQKHTLIQKQDFLELIFLLDILDRHTSEILKCKELRNKNKKELKSFLASIRVFLQKGSSDNSEYQNRGNSDNSEYQNRRNSDNSEYRIRFIVYFLSKLTAKFCHKFTSIKDLSIEISRKYPEDHKLLKKKIENDITFLELGLCSFIVSYNERQTSA